MKFSSSIMATFENIAAARDRDVIGSNASIESRDINTNKQRYMFVSEYLFKMHDTVGEFMPTGSIGECLMEFEHAAREYRKSKGID